MSGTVAGPTHGAPPHGGDGRALALEPALRAIGVVPVVALGAPVEARALGEALTAGGLPCAEITFRTEAAADGIAALRADFPNLLVGAGTVLTVGQADAAVRAGARFLVSPGFNPAVVDHALAEGVPVLPGVCTPTEIEMALARDLRLVKLFPAAQAGGVGFVRAVGGPYPMVRFVPTGGISPDNLEEYLRVPSVTACGGTWLCKPDVLARGDVETMRRLAAEAVAIVARARGAAVTG